MCSLIIEVKYSKRYNLKINFTRVTWFFFCNELIKRAKHILKPILYCFYPSLFRVTPELEGINPIPSVKLLRYRKVAFRVLRLINLYVCTKNRKMNNCFTNILIINNQYVFCISLCNRYNSRKTVDIRLNSDPHKPKHMANYRKAPGVFDERITWWIIAKIKKLSDQFHDGTTKRVWFSLVVSRKTVLMVDRIQAPS